MKNIHEQLMVDNPVAEQGVHTESNGVPDLRNIHNAHELLILGDPASFFFKFSVDTEVSPTVMANKSGTFIGHQGETLPYNPGDYFVLFPKLENHPPVAGWYSALAVEELMGPNLAVQVEPIPGIFNQPKA